MVEFAIGGYRSVDIFGVPVFICEYAFKLLTEYLYFAVAVCYFFSCCLTLSEEILSCSLLIDFMYFQNFLPIVALPLSSSLVGSWVSHRLRTY